MADPYRAYHDDDDDDEEENMDPAVAETIDAKTLEKGIQMSLQSYTQEQGNPVQAQEEADPVPQNTRDHEVPRRPFTAEEIAQDDLRRERELYGPPTPPRRPRTVASLNSNVETFAPRVANTLDASDIVRIIKGKGKESVKRNASDSRKVYEKGERIMEDMPTAMGASWLTNTTKQTLEDMILTVKMVILLGSIQCPPVYSAATYEIASSIAAGLEDVVADTAAADATAAAAATEPASACSECSNAAVAGSSRGSESPDPLADMAGMNDAHRLNYSQEPESTGAIIGQPTPEIAGQTINDNESALFSSAARPEDGVSPVDAVVALGVPDDTNESSSLGQNFDDILAHRYETRVAEIDALLDSENAALDAALQAAHDRRIARGTSVADPVQAAREEELEWFLDESSGNARPGSEQAQSPRQKSQPKHGKFGFEGRGKPLD